MLQTEFSFTQVLDRPVTGRVFFEQVIRENLDLGRPSQVQLIFDNRDLRVRVAELLALAPEQFTPGQMTYDLRRLRLHGLIERIPHSNRYQVTDFGFRSALFLTRAYTRLLRPGLAVVMDRQPPAPALLDSALAHVDRAIERIWAQHRIAA